MANAIAETNKSHYLASLKQLGADGLPAWAEAIRREGEARFRAAPMPHPKLEEWRQTNVSDIVNTAYTSLVTPTTHNITPDAADGHFLGDGSWTELVFVDGYYAPGLSRTRALPDGVRVAGLGEAIAAGDAVAKEHLGTVLGKRGAFPALNSAFLQDGIFIHVPANTVLKTPVHVLFLTTARPADTVSHIRNLVVLGESAEATVTMTYAALSDTTPYLNNVVDEVVLGPNGHLQWHKIVREGAEGKHLATTEIIQARDSRLESFTAALTGKVSRNQLCVRLVEEGASCSLTGLYINNDTRLIDNALDITHAAPHCSSRIAYKGVLDGRSKTVFTGKVNVARDAQQTDSDQLSNNLLLSDTATIDAKPQLEIYADDVKCTHGATVGAPPEEIIFYFRSRGIGEEAARAMLTFGFAEAVVAEIEETALRDSLTRHLEAVFRVGGHST